MSASQTVVESPRTKHGGMSSSTVGPPIFCEILDQRTQLLISEHPSLGTACNFLVSNRLISKVMAMVAEDRKVAKILDLLLSGSISMCLKPSRLYVKSKEIVSFFTIQKRAQQLNHVT